MSDERRENVFVWGETEIGGRGMQEHGEKVVEDLGRREVGERRETK